MDYRQAKKIRDKSFGTLFAEQEGGFGQSLKATISQKTKAKVAGIKESFDILNIAKKLTGGSNWAPAMLGKIIGSDKKRIDYFSGVKPKNTASLESPESSGSLNSPEALESLGYIYKSLKQSIDDRHDSESKQKEQEKKDEEFENTRNDELVKALTARRKKKEKKKPNKEEKEKTNKPSESGKTNTKETPKGNNKSNSVETTKTETPKNVKQNPATTATSTKTTPVIPSGAITGAVVAGTSALLSENALARIKSKEGFVEKAYFDPKVGATRDLYSVGHGHQITDDEIKKGYIQIGNKTVPVLGENGKDTKITKTEAGELLKIDYKKYEDYAKTLPNFNSLNMNAQVALVDMTYNMGVGWAKGWPILLNQLQNLDLEGAAQNIENSRYIKQVGKRGIESANLVRNGLTGVPVTPVKSENNLGNQIENSSKENKNLKSDISEEKDKPSPTISNNVNNQKTQQESTNTISAGSDRPAYINKVRM